MPWPGHECHRLHHVGLLVSPEARSCVDDLLLRGARGICAEMKPSKMMFVALAEDLRPEHRERDAHDAEQDHEHDERALGAEPSEQSLRARPEVHRLLAGHRHHAHRAAAHGSAPHRRTGRSLRFLSLVGHAAASSVLSWLSTISA
jgi:hypothetical protein